MEYFLGIDGGATKTHTVLTDASGRPLGEGQSGPSNYHIVGEERAGANIAASTSHALAECKAVSPACVKAACAGVAGFDGPSDRASVHRLLHKALAECEVDCRCRCVNDSVVAWAGAFEGNAGALIASGSGAVAFAVGPDGRSARADGLGHWLGDVGSGFYIGRRGLRAALAALDGRGPSTCLADRFRNIAGCSQQEWIGWIAKLDTAIDYAHLQLRSFAPFVTQAAAEGDSVALAILKESGAALASTAAAVLRKVGLLDGAQVATAGTLLTGSSHLRRAFCAALTAQLPDCLIVPARTNPALGAALLARSPAVLPQNVLQTGG